MHQPGEEDEICRQEKFQRGLRPKWVKVSAHLCAHTFFHFPDLPGDYSDVREEQLNAQVRTFINRVARSHRQGCEQHQPPSSNTYDKINFKKGCQTCLKHPRVIFTAKHDFELRLRHANPFKAESNENSLIRQSLISAKHCLRAHRGLYY